MRDRNIVGGALLLLGLAASAQAAPAVKMIAASGSGSLALASDGTLGAWGWNGDSELGDELTVNPRRLVQVIPPGSPDLAIGMSRDGDFVVGAGAVHTLTIANTGLTTTTGPLTVADTLPPGLTGVSSTGMGWGCLAAEEAVTCTNPGPVDPGASTSIALRVEVGSSACPGPGVTNLARVSNESDRNISNNTIGDPTVVLTERN